MDSTVSPRVSEPVAAPSTAFAHDALASYFSPRTVAVVGAGRVRGRIGAEIFHNLIADGFCGRAIPVNPHAAAVDGIPAYARVTDIPDAVDLAVIAVPATAVETTIDDCIAKGIPAVVVITAGFSETGPEGREREIALRDKVRGAGMRMIGPNCMGIATTDPAVRLNATFSPVFPPAGPVAISTQSGALGLAILQRAAELNLGISSFVSVGNKADVSTNDLIAYWADDPHTKVILLYVESFGNPRRFKEIASRVARTKPIVAVKAGRSRAGARAATSHTGALAASDMIVDALFRETGVIRTETMEELFDVAELLAHQPLPAGPRVAILTNAGGPGILAADACEAHGLQLPALAAATVADLRRFLPTAASVANPVDMLATASADDYRRAVTLLLADPGVDSLLTIFIPPLVTRTDEVARALATAVRGARKPVLANFFGAAGVPEVLAPVPCYTFPESAARALAHAVTYAHWRTVAPDLPAVREVDHHRLRTLVGPIADAGGGWLSSVTCHEILQACGIHAVPTHLVTTLEQALNAARRCGYPVVLKGSGPAIVHKTESKAVLLDLADEAAVQGAFAILSRRPDVREILVQPLVRDGVEVLVGATRDPAFGPVVVCGSGGTLVELLRDTSCRLAPLTDRSAREMLEEIRGIALLRGFRGRPICDEAALRDVLLRVSALLDACPEIVELDLNPVLVTGSDAVVADVRLRVGVPPAAPPRPRRAPC